MAWPTNSARTKTWGTEVLTASDLQTQYDLLHQYFIDSLNGTTGHGHTGGTNDGLKIVLTTAVTGILPVANGGTGVASGFLPIGEIVMWGTNSAPTNFLLCDGTAISRTTYSSLFSVLSTTFGTGDGSTTFNLPDYRGLVPVGRKASDANFDILKTPTTYVGTKTNDISHTHTIPNAGGTYTDGGGVDGGISRSASSFSNIIGNTITSNTGGSTTMNNLSPYIVINFIIRYA